MLIGLLAAVMQYTAVRIVVVKLPCKVKKNCASAETGIKYMLYFHAGYLKECVISLNYPVASLWHLETYTLSSQS